MVVEPQRDAKTMPLMHTQASKKQDAANCIVWPLISSSVLGGWSRASTISMPHAKIQHAPPSEAGMPSLHARKNIHGVKGSAGKVFSPCKYPQCKCKDYKPEKKA
jgi:hypothetical protein